MRHITAAIKPIPILITLRRAACAQAAAPPTPLDPPTPLTVIAASPTTRPTAVSSPTAAPLPERVVDGQGAEMILVPAGEFIMGSDAGFRDEKPVHTVYVDAYYIDRLETTNRQYKACVDAGACQPPVRLDCCSKAALVLWPSYFGNPKFDDYPVTWLDWYRARDYCVWRGVRLATEAEWEKAARGTDGRTYPWGNAEPTPDRLNFAWLPGEFDHKPLPGTAPVGSYPAGASPYGVLDMAGNVYEWIQDAYAPDYYQVSPDRNPPGPDGGKFRIARGGSFFNTAFRNRASNRNNAFLPADLAEFDAGVRCASSVPGG